MDLKKIRGFTLIEILTVICIIVILIGLLQPALRTAREQAYKQKAKAMVGSLEVAINMYYTDTGSYPTETTRWESMLVNRTGNYGPYMDNKDYDGTNFKDPWDKEYNCKRPGRKNTSTFDVWSYGINKTNNNTGLGTDTGDDIGNW